jgi:putative pyruvate formate lyase activating enzyme
METMKPVYIETHRKGLLREKAETAWEALRHCRLCPRMCGVDRLKNAAMGICKTGASAVVASYHPHFGEETPLVGTNGSGTIFFTHCNLNCCFCQNFDISHGGAGRSVTSAELAAMMIELQNAGCHNINVVSPSHVVPQILSALEIAVRKGLEIPLIYNTGGYDRVSTLKRLEGVIDIYMPDFKFWHSDISAMTCQAPDYPDVCCAALKEMHSQVGDLVVDDRGVARQGLLVRHLVMPQNLAGTREIMSFMATQISRQTYVNVMGQYRPCGRAGEIDGLSRRISMLEFRQAVRDAREAGLTRLD